LLFLLFGLFLLRQAARTFCDSLLNEPPRRTRCFGPDPAVYAICIADCQIGKELPIPAACGGRKKIQRFRVQRFRFQSIYERRGASTTRNPSLSSPLNGLSLARQAARTTCDSPLNEPPRRTRITSSPAFKFSRPSFGL